MIKIIDEYTDLPVSRQRKEQLRHPEKYKVQKKKYRASEKGRLVINRHRSERYYRTMLSGLCRICIEPVSKSRKDLCEKHRLMSNKSDKLRRLKHFNNW